MSRILVTGASGLLGLNFGLHFHQQHEIIGIINSHTINHLPFSIQQADLAQPGSATRLVKNIRPDVVLHCAALANVDQAEMNPSLAQRINVDAAGEIASAARNVGSKMVHISTDAIFDGVRGSYSEEDEPNPINVYARTKYAGEKAVLKANPEAIVARVNFYGWSLGGKRSLAELFYNTLSTGSAMRGFTDVFFCPLEVNLLGEILLKMVEINLSGIYHVLSSEMLSKYEFGRRIARRFGLDENLVQPVSWKEAGLTAVRSPNLTMQTGKLAAALGQPLPGQDVGFDRFFALFQEGFRERIRQFSG